MLLTGLAAAALVAWAGVLALPWLPYRNRERIEAADGDAFDLGDVTVLIPARNEADVLARTLTALGRQGLGLAVLVIDDESTDDTPSIGAEFASRTDGRLRVDLLRGSGLPPGWGGKLWALQQGLARVERPYVLLLDADIELAPGMLPALVAQSRATGAALVSVMAKLRCRSFWERLLVPPFVFFFKLIYPFARVNDVRAGTAAAAGGCILARTAVLREIGGFEMIRGALIDDCTLARTVKRRGHTIWLGLSRSVASMRRYETLADFARMVARTAFTQLGYSTVLLVLVTLAMFVVFVAPAAALVLGPGWGPRALGALAVLALCAAYLPTVRFYQLPVAWSLTLPFAAVLFLGMTWWSAINYWRGVRAEWKDRAYATHQR